MIATDQTRIALKDLEAGDKVLLAPCGTLSRAVVATVDAIHAGNGNLKVRGQWYRIDGGLAGGGGVMRRNSSRSIIPASPPRFCLATSGLIGVQPMATAWSTMGNWTVPASLTRTLDMGPLHQPSFVCNG